MAKAEASRRLPFDIGDVSVAPGARQTIELPVSVLANHVPVTLPVHVVHGRRPGPTLFLSAAIHGDEIVGVEIIRRVLKTPKLAERLGGTLLAVPIVNVFGFVSRSRYLPDRRDLNRSFPGTESGSLASQLAHLFVSKIVRRSDYGIDLHSAAQHRANLPQIRGDFGHADTHRLAEAFAAPVMLHANLRDGSLRQAAREAGTTVLLYEAGEALRFDDLAIRAGVRGVQRVMQALDMLWRRKADYKVKPSILCRTSGWIRAPEGGVLRTRSVLGDRVEAGQPLGVVSDPFGESEAIAHAKHAGIIIGSTRLPVVNRGDALFHIAQPAEVGEALSVSDYRNDLDADPLADNEMA